MSRYRLSSLAETDLDRIWWQLAEDASIATADRIAEAIVERFALLARHRAAGRIREDIAPGIRSFVVDTYIVYYAKEGNHILVARVLHGSRDQYSAFQQET